MCLLTRFRIARLRLKRVIFLVLCAGCASGCGSEPEYGGKPLSQWIKQLKSSDYNARWEAAEALGHFGSEAKAAVPALIDFSHVETSCPNVAGMSLKDIGPDAIPELIRALQHPNEWVRGNAAFAIGQNGPKA